VQHGSSSTFCFFSGGEPQHGAKLSLFSFSMVSAFFLDEQHDDIGIDIGETTLFSGMSPCAFLERACDEVTTAAK
jgi:hypothetical protein